MAATPEIFFEASPARFIQRKGEVMSTLDYCRYLGLDYEGLDAPLVWIAREMCVARLPPNIVVEEAFNQVLIFYDPINQLRCLEHPYYRWFAQVLEVSRLNLLILRNLPEQHLISQEPMLVHHEKFGSLLQITCEDCLKVPGFKHCQECLLALCETCWNLRHGNPGSHTFKLSAQAPAQDSQVEEDPTQSVGWPTTIGTLRAESCVQCGQLATLPCKPCRESFCLTCFWETHRKGQRRTHYSQTTVVQPLCQTCFKLRATLYGTYDSEFYCNPCFFETHQKGARRAHLFEDATNLPLVLELMDPLFRQTFELRKQRILRQIHKLQARVRGGQTRDHQQIQHQMAATIQARWRAFVEAKKPLLEAAMNESARKAD